MVKLVIGQVDGFKISATKKKSEQDKELQETGWPS